MIRRTRLALLALSVAVLTVLLVWGSMPRTTAVDRALAALDAYETAQAALHRDLVSLRAGLLQNYDPLVVVSVDRLARASANLSIAEQTGLAGRARALQASAAEQVELAEALKSDAALLQNRPRLLQPAQRTGARRQRSAGERACGGHAAADPEHRPGESRGGGEAARRVRRRPQLRTSARGEALLAHAGLIERLLPQTDETLRRVLAADPIADRRALRAELIAQRARAKPSPWTCGSLLACGR